MFVLDIDLILLYSLLNLLTFAKYIKITNIRKLFCSQNVNYILMNIKYNVHHKLFLFLTAT